MNLFLKRRLRISIGIICSLAALLCSVPVYAAGTESLESQSSALQQELNGINNEIAGMLTEVADIEVQIENTNNAIISTEEQLAIIKNNESQQYEDMKKRIQYMYENGNPSMIELLFTAKTLADFVNKADFIVNVSTYDREQLNALQETHLTIEEQQTSLNEQKASLEAMQNDLQTKQEALNQKATETATNLSSLTAQIDQIKAEQARAAEEAAAQAAQAAAAETGTSQSASGSGSTGGSTQPSSGGSAPNYGYSSGGGLTPSKGVVYFNGHRETYYSQRVLPGTGLNISGRHVAADGTIRDSENYICVASSDYPKGTLIETSLGMGKVYDSGCASGTVDLYTDW